MQIADKSLLSRITSNPQILTGKPVIRDLRIPVDLILELLAKGASSAEILEDYPDLEPADIQAALFYASAKFNDRITGCLTTSVNI